MTFETILTSISGVVGAVVASFIWERKIRDRVYAKRITSPDDEDIPGLIELYTELFPDDTIDYSAEELCDFFEKQEEGEGLRHVEADDILLVAKFKGAVVGFMFCHYYPERHKAIVSYYGIDKNVLEARKLAASVLLKSIEKLLVRKHKECEFLFFDVARPGKELSKEENLERKARISLFMQSARLIRKKAYVFQIDYHSPRVSMADETHERPLVLMFIPLKTQIPTIMKKSEVMSFLRYIFFDCYGDIYRVDDPRFEEYQKHLKEQVDEFEKVLPEEVLLSCNTLPNNGVVPDAAKIASSHTP